MTEDEAKKALFKVHYDYMMHTPKERLALYDEYREKRDNIKRELANAIQKRNDGNEGAIKKYKV